MYRCFPIPVSREDFERTKQKAMEDLQKLDSDINQIPERFKSVLNTFRDLEPKYDEIPDLLGSMNSAQGEKAQRFRRNIEDCSSDIQELQEELGDFKEKLLEMVEDIEHLSEDLDADRETLDRVTDEVREDSV